MVLPGRYKRVQIKQQQVRPCLGCFLGHGCLVTCSEPERGLPSLLRHAVCCLLLTEPPGLPTCTFQSTADCPPLPQGVRFEEFDFSYYNRTPFTGLENDLANCYTNALLQVRDGC